MEGTPTDYSTHKGVPHIEPQENSRSKMTWIFTIAYDSDVCVWFLVRPLLCDNSQELAGYVYRDEQPVTVPEVAYESQAPERQIVFGILAGHVLLLSPSGPLWPTVRSPRNGDGLPPIPVPLLLSVGIVLPLSNTDGDNTITFCDGHIVCGADRENIDVFHKRPVSLLSVAGGLQWTGSVSLSVVAWILVVVRHIAWDFLHNPFFHSLVSYTSTHTSSLHKQNNEKFNLQ